MEKHAYQAVAKGKTFFTYLLLLFVAAEFLRLYLEVTHNIQNRTDDWAWSAIMQELKSFWIWTIIFGTFFFLTYMGLRWAKWVLSILLVIIGLSFFFEGFEQWGFFVLAGIYVFTGFILHNQPNLTAFLQSQRTIGSDEHPQADGDADFNAEGLPISPTPPLIDLYVYPTLLKRVQTTFIDSLLVLFVLVLFFSFVDSVGGIPLFLKLLVVALGISYEPLMTSFSATLGQRLMGIRVRQYKDKEGAISIPKAYLRVLMKGLLGWLSYLTIHSNAEKRAIHDLAAGSVMIYVKNTLPIATSAT